MLHTPMRECSQIKRVSQQRGHVPITVCGRSDKDVHRVVDQAGNIDGRVPITKQSGAFERGS